MNKNILSYNFMLLRRISGKYVGSTSYYKTNFHSRRNYSLKQYRWLVEQQISASKSVHYSQSNVLQPKLSPHEVTHILRNNEKTLLFDENRTDKSWHATYHAIASADSNQLASNSPIEDKIAISKCLLTTGFLFGVFDGHGGPACSQVVSKRLFNYIAASLLPRNELQRVISEIENGKEVKLTEVFNDDTEFVPELQEIYDNSLLNWCKKILNSGKSEFRMDDALSNSFIQLDSDISEEVLRHQGQEIFPVLLDVALSGSVACVAHIDGPHLHVANTGDCGALLGEVGDDNQRKWIGTRLTKDHNFENTSELQRIFSEHPEKERDFVIQGQRLLGMLMPFRAFGDVRFKWNKDLQLKVIQPFSPIDTSFLKHCITPPYLTAKPEVSYRRLRSQERFLILASDGLWESMNAFDIVNLVGEYMSGCQTLQPIQFTRQSVTLGDALQILRKRQEGLEVKPSDINACTHLIRHCLGGTEEGLDHQRLAHSLTLPPSVRRCFRDDISIHIIFFDSDFLRLCPIELQ